MDLLQTKIYNLCRTKNSRRGVGAADFAHAMTTMIPNQKRKKWSDQKLQKKSYSCSTFMLYLGVDKLYDEPHHQIYASADYENSLRDIDNHKIPWNDPSVYVQNACITDPSLAPDGQSTLYVLVPVPNSKVLFAYMVSLISKL